MVLTVQARDLFDCFFFTHFLTALSINVEKISDEEMLAFVGEYDVLKYVKPRTPIFEWL